MTEQEIAELVARLRRAATHRASMTLGTSSPESMLESEAADLIEAQQASYESACTRAEEAEARNVFLLTELERILKEAK